MQETFSLSPPRGLLTYLDKSYSPHQCKARDGLALDFLYAEVVCLSMCSKLKKRCNVNIQSDTPVIQNNLDIFLTLNVKKQSCAYFFQSQCNLLFLLLTRFDRMFFFILYFYLLFFYSDQCSIAVQCSC